MVDRLLLTTPLNRFQCKGELMPPLFLFARSRQTQLEVAIRQLRVNLSASRVNPPFVYRVLLSQIHTRLFVQLLQNI